MVFPVARCCSPLSNGLGLLAAEHLCALFSCCIVLPRSCRSSAGDQLLPAPAAALSPCTHRSLPDCTESTKEKKETGSLAAVCVVYKASFAGFVMPGLPGCPSTALLQSPGRAEQSGGEQDLSLRGGNGDTGTSAPSPRSSCAGICLSSQGCIFAGPLERPECHQGQGDVPRSVPIMGVKAEGGSPSSLALGPCVRHPRLFPGTPDCAWHPRLCPGTPQPPWAWPQPALQVPACRGGTQLGHREPWLCTLLRMGMLPIFIPPFWFCPLVMPKMVFCRIFGVLLF